MARRALRGFLAALALGPAACGRPLPGPPPLPPGAAWHDDWYALMRIDDRSFAVSEPRYEQHNVSYLLMGDTRALLLDTGPGERDPRPLVASLTSLPVTATASHLHFDHVGGHERFEGIASVDLPSMRARIAADGRFTPSFVQHGGPGRPSFRIGEWWAPDAAVDLGGRTLQVLSTPGHTRESITLWDAASCQLYTGDFLYPGDLFAFTPDADLAAYRESARRLLRLGEPCGDTLSIWGAHVPRPDASPRQTRADLVRLEAALDALLAGDAGGGRLALVMGIPVRRHEFAGGLAILMPVW